MLIKIVTKEPETDPLQTPDNMVPRGYLYHAEYVFCTCYVGRLTHEMPHQCRRETLSLLASVCPVYPRQYPGHVNRGRC
jgi:hypothetical protein